MDGAPGLFGGNPWLVWTCTFTYTCPFHRSPTPCAPSPTCPCEYIRLLQWPKENPFGGGFPDTPDPPPLLSYLSLHYSGSGGSALSRVASLTSTGRVSPRRRAAGRGRPQTHPVGVPEITGENGRAQHHRRDLQIDSG